MPKLPTHYDTLHVRRDATADVIRTAYKQLARRYHPDRNQDSAESHRLMQELNTSFDVLDDPIRRAEHDRWIAECEQAWSRRIRVGVRALGEFLLRPFTAVRRVASTSSRAQRIRLGWIGAAGLTAVVVTAIVINRQRSETAPQPNSPITTAEPTSPKAQAYERPSTAPNGLPWPVGAAALAGFAVEHNDGRSEVTVDNSRNTTDVFVRLVSVENGSPVPVRYFYIPARRTFRCQTVRPGHYEVWYQDLNTGALKRSEPFELVETRTEQRINYSLMRIILYKMADGLEPAHRLTIDSN